MIYDQHIHTRFSVDSKEEMENYLKLLKDKEMKYFISCDHIDFDLINYHNDWLCDFDARRAEIDRLKKIYPEITFLEGVELGFRKDHLDDMRGVLKRKFDLVQLSVHDNGVYDFYKDVKSEEVMNVYFDYILEAVSTWDDFNTLSHIDYGFKTYKRFNTNADINNYEDILNKIFKVLISKGKALEVNTKVQSAVNDEFFTHLRDLLKMYKNAGGRKLTLSSDSHTTEFFMVDFEKYVQVIKESGFDSLSYFINREEHLYKI